jgi:hypothetical protein
MRPSGVPGITIGGDARKRYHLIHEPSGRLFNVEANRFRLVRDAKAAAARLEPLGPWDRAADDLTLDRKAIFDALTGTTAETRPQRQRPTTGRPRA